VTTGLRSTASRSKEITCWASSTGSLELVTTPTPTSSPANDPRARCPPIWSVTSSTHPDRTNMDSPFGSAAAGLLGLAEDDQAGDGTTHR